ncbi:MAG: hypothetical protein JWR21_949 [Herminiimonas sp.]|nr:hypothetical protein [Herminiimonas sp.]MDB5852396.1 hypothetical protein [Herminiimonas sp.]
MAEWNTLFAGEKDGRLIKLEQYYEGNSLRLTATAIGSAANDASVRTVPAKAANADADTEAKLEIHAVDAVQLEKRLVSEAGFSETAAREIAKLGHAGSASVPPQEKA